MILLSWVVDLGLILLLFLVLICRVREQQLRALENQVLHDGLWVMLDREDHVDRIDARALRWRQHHFSDCNLSCPSGTHPDVRAMWWRQRCFEEQHCSPVESSLLGFGLSCQSGFLNSCSIALLLCLGQAVNQDS